MPSEPGAYLVTVIVVVLDTPNVAVSDSPLGTLAGVQFAAVCQTLLAGLRFHVELPAYASWSAILTAMITANRLIPECILASTIAESWHPEGVEQ